jgi:hypothetical protein
MTPLVLMKKKVDILKRLLYNLLSEVDLLFVNELLVKWASTHLCYFLI